ncbi:MAG: class II fructose-bisphosphate aldolase [Galactobacter sp.]
MTRENFSGILTARRETGQAIGAFNVIQLEHATAIVAAAERCDAPVILQISENATRYHGTLAPIGRACLELAEQAAVPVAVHLDHATSVDLCTEAMELGFDSVMIDASQKDWDRNVETTRQVAAAGTAAGVWVEAELGEIGGKGAHVSGARTDPEEAKTFVAATGIDALAVAIGSSHAMTSKDADLDLDLLSRLRAAVPVPLVLHGSSGVPDDLLIRAVQRGITKVNVGTQLNIAFTREVRVALDHSPDLTDPRRYLGPGRQAMTDTISGLLRVIAQADTHR